ncbi:MAG TPA: extracellular solute-binding protein [Anaerolineales bacterium]|nr:extracellular solute-binding protein [Anaerolineales bacterium]
MKTIVLTLGLFSLVLMACAGLPAPFGAATQTPTSAPTATIAVEPITTKVPSPEPEGPMVLRIWVPPQFDPASGRPAGALLQARLDEFKSRRSGVGVEVRVKAETGSGGLLDSLSTANSAAPLALPDLVLLPRGELEIAAIKGLLFPHEDLTNNLDGGDWYPYAEQLARLQNSVFGLPFASDGLLLAYRPADVPQPPGDWESALGVAAPLIFPAADESALHTLIQYLATGAKIQDEEGRPVLDSQALTQVLSFYQQAQTAGVMPFWLTQYSNDDQAWEAYTQKGGNLVITWISRYLGELPGDTAAAPLPTQDGEVFTLVNGWVWALSNPQIERHALSVELADFLTSGDFLAKFTETGGYLPQRASALAGWSNPALKSLIGEIVNAAQVLPPADVLTVLSPAFHQATIEVLKDQADPATAAQQASQGLANP